VTSVRNASGLSMCQRSNVSLYASTHKGRRLFDLRPEAFAGSRVVQPIESCCSRQSRGGQMRPISISTMTTRSTSPMAPLGP
jgi:hypothetical protein